MWKIEFLKAALEDLKNLDQSQRIQVIKAIYKVSSNPLPRTEGGYGKPLGSKRDSKLSGYCKIKLKKLGLRVVYKLLRDEQTMIIIVISKRIDNEVYSLAQKRTER